MLSHERITPVSSFAMITEDVRRSFESFCRTTAKVRFSASMTGEAILLSRSKAIFLWLIPEALILESACMCLFIT